MKICLIDDERDMTELTGSLLKFSGFDVETLNDPVEGLARLKANPFDAVVVDIMMPELDGLTLMKELRQAESYKTTPIFALSAKKLKDDERKFMLDADIHFVQKPFEPRRLVTLIKETLGA
jgi:two-component system chemotaxis response regulator CheY